MLLKRRYSLTEEEQPFGLRWFIPEFYRQRTLLGQVAIAILAISLLGLVIPLFFQIVVDKVLVNHITFNTTSDRFVMLVRNFPKPEKRKSLKKIKFCIIFI